MHKLGELDQIRFRRGLIRHRPRLKFKDEKRQHSVFRPLHPALRLANGWIHVEKMAVVNRSPERPNGHRTDWWVEHLTWNEQYESLIKRTAKSDL